MENKIVFSSTTNMLLVKDGSILLIKRSESLADFPGWFMLPGGKQEKDETPEETAIRETFEETGVQVRNATLKVVATNNHEYRSKVYLVFLFTSDEFTGELKESKEGMPEWIPINEALDSQKLYPDLKRLINLALKPDSQNTAFVYHKFNEKLEIIDSH